MNPEEASQITGAGTPAPAAPAAQTVTSLRPSTVFTPPADPSSYIRTYAKDVAALTNNPASTAPLTSDAASLPASGGIPTPSDGASGSVELPEYDPSPVNNRNDPASPKEFKQEVEVLSATDSDGIFTESQDQLGRETILARLREKVSGGQQPGSISLAPTSVNIPAPTAPTLGSIPLPSEIADALPPMPAVSPEAIEAVHGIPTAEIPPVRALEPTPPILPEAPASVPAQPISPYREVLPLPENEVPYQFPNPETLAPLPESAPSPIHTYSSDFSDHIDAQNSSTFSVLAAQSDAGQTPAPSRAPRKRNLFPLIAGALMVLIGIGAVIGAYVYMRNTNSVPTVASAPALVTYDESIQLSGSGSQLMKALSDASQGASISGNVVVAYLVSQESGMPGMPQPGGALINALSLPAPDILLRNIDPSSTVGFIRAGSESRPFFVLKVNSYERTFAGMLAWESTVADDLSVLYPQYPAISQQANISTTTASTSEVQLLSAVPTTFTDAVVNNHDVRVLRDASGRSILIYGYQDKDILIIARDEAAFTALSSRLSAGGH